MESPKFSPSRLTPAQNKILQVLSPERRAALGEVISNVQALRGHHDTLNLCFQDTVYMDEDNGLAAQEVAALERRRLTPAQRMVARFSLARATPVIKSLEAGFVVNWGDWTATDEIETGLTAYFDQLLKDPNYSIVARDSEQVRFAVRPGAVRAMGLTALRRMRPLYQSGPRYAIVPHKQGEYDYPEMTYDEHGGILETGPLVRTGGQVNLRVIETRAAGFKRSDFLLDAWVARERLQPLYDELRAIYDQHEEGFVYRTAYGPRHFDGLDPWNAITGEVSRQALQQTIDATDSEVLMPATTGYVHVHQLQAKSAFIPPRAMQRFAGLTDYEVAKALGTGLFITPELAHDLAGQRSQLQLRPE